MRPMGQQTAGNRRQRRRSLVLLAIAACLTWVAAAGCASTANAPERADIVTQIPWTAPETHTYELRENNKFKATTTLNRERRRRVRADAAHDR